MATRTNWISSSLHEKRLTIWPHRYVPHRALKEHHIEGLNPHTYQVSHHVNDRMLQGKGDNSINKHILHTYFLPTPLIWIPYIFACPACPDQASDFCLGEVEYRYIYIPVLRRGIFIPLWRRIFTHGHHRFDKISPWFFTTKLPGEAINRWSTHTEWLLPQRKPPWYPTHRNDSLPPELLCEEIIRRCSIYCIALPHYLHPRIQHWKGAFFNPFNKSHLR